MVLPESSVGVILVDDRAGLEAAYGVADLRPCVSVTERRGRGGLDTIDAALYYARMKCGSGRMGDLDWEWLVLDTERILNGPDSAVMTFVAHGDPNGANECIEAYQEARKAHVAAAAMRLLSAD